MQVWLGETYYGDITQHIHPDQHCWEIATLDAALSKPWAGDPGNVLVRPEIRTIRLYTARRRYAVALPEYVARNPDDARRLVGDQARSAHVCREAKMTMERNLEHCEMRYRWDWTVLVCPEDIAEQVFDLDCFTPA
jgi:hypothetical protein